MNPPAWLTGLVLITHALVREHAEALLGGLAEAVRRPGLDALQALSRLDPAARQARVARLLGAPPDRRELARHVRSLPSPLRTDVLRSLSPLARSSAPGAGRSRGPPGRWGVRLARELAARWASRCPGGEEAPSPAGDGARGSSPGRKEWRAF